MNVFGRISNNYNTAGCCCCCRRCCCCDSCSVSYWRRHVTQSYRISATVGSVEPGAVGLSGETASRRTSQSASLRNCGGGRDLCFFCARVCRRPQLENRTHVRRRETGRLAPVVPVQTRFRCFWRTACPPATQQTVQPASDRTATLQSRPQPASVLVQCSDSRKYKYVYITTNRPNTKSNLKSNPNLTLLLNSMQ